MFTLDDIDGCQARARSYTELAGNLRRLGLHSYTVDVATEAKVYRGVQGELLQRAGNKAVPVTAAFVAADVSAAIRRSQRGEIGYPGFMQQIHAAGVSHYEAVLVGPHPRVIYFGAGGLLEEPIPL